MAAKAALLAVLADSSLIMTEKDMVSSALTTARQYKLGVLPLRKLLDEMTNSQGKKPVETVEDAVMEVVEHACGSCSIEKERKRARPKPPLLTGTARTIVPYTNRKYAIRATVTMTMTRLTAPAAFQRQRHWPWQQSSKLKPRSRSRRGPQLTTIR